MIPKLYRTNNDTATSRTFLGYINRCSKGICRFVAGGEYIIELTTDVNDFTEPSLISQNIIEVKPNYRDPAQLFIIKKTERKINGIINVYAEHIRMLCNQYTTTGAVVYADEDEGTITNVTPAEAWDEIINNNMPLTARPPFTFTSDITTRLDFSLGLTKAETLGNILAGTEGSFLDKWRGDFYYNNFNIFFRQKPTTVQPYTLRYGQNISDATQSEEFSNAYSYILPYGTVKDEATGNDLVLSGDITAIPNSMCLYKKTFLYDCSDRSRNLKVYSQRTSTHDAGDGYPEARQKMTQYALSYARSKNLANTLATIEITNRSELNEMKALNVGDKVKVVLDNFGTTTQSQIVEGEFDFLLERWNKLTVGESKTTLANLFYNRQKYSNGR